MDSDDIHHDIDPNFEPLTRARSNTWPLRPPKQLEPHNSPVGVDDSSNGVDQHLSVKDPLGLTTKKSGSRRNAWGNLSYADLITKAIQSSPEKRLTLSQIYDWMVQNVPYFKDKGDSTSSAGWKNSIRHNLSLHNRFMRIQNEGTGKSSWWVLNPDAKQVKSHRRRAVTMDKSYEKRRGRVKKKVEALQATMENGEALSLNGGDDVLEMPTFGDFRSRADSTASSGRLSPIQAATESDLHENQVPPMSPIPWETEVRSSPTSYQRESYQELVKSLVAGMKLSNQDGLKGMDISGISDAYHSVSPRDFSNQPSPYMDVNHSSPSLENHYSHLPAPPPYPKQQQQQMNGIEFDTSNFSNRLCLQRTSSPVINGSTTFSQSDLYSEYSVMNIKRETDTPSPGHLATPNSLSVNTQINSPDRSQQGSPIIGSYARLSPQGQSGPVNGRLPLSQLTCQVSPQQIRHLIKLEPVSAASLQHQQIFHQIPHDSILRDALTRGSPVYRSHSATNTPSPTYSPIGNRSPLSLDTSSCNINNGMVNIGMTLNSNVSPHYQGLPTGQMQVMNETLTNSGVGVTNNPGVPLDIDIDFVSGLDYDMDQVINQELNFDGILDFNFESAPATSVGQSVVH